MVAKKIWFIFFFICCFFSINSQLIEKDFSSKPSVETDLLYDEGLILFRFDINENYHITDLKNNFFRIELIKNNFYKIGEILFPEGVPYEDEMVFKGKFDVKVYLKPLTDKVEPLDLTFKISYQICQERPEELCFAPESVQHTVKMDRALGDVDLDLLERLLQLFKRELEKKSVLLFLLVFVAGFLTSFTPCVYPVIPIVMGYIGSRSGDKKIKGFYLSIFFVLGLALVYSILGIVAAATGSIIGISFQNPVVVIVIAGIFILMGLSLAGLFEIPVPSSISSKVQSSYKFEVLGALIVGGISGIIAAPCVGPVLIAILSWISQTGNIFLGFWITFVFSLGLGVIFLILGTFSGMITSLPKAGNWMNTIKYIFSVLLVGGGLYILSLIGSPWIDHLLWGMGLIVLSVFMGLFRVLKKDSTRAILFKSAGVIIFLLGAFLVFKSLEIKFFPGDEVISSTITSEIQWITDLEEGKEKARKENKILMIDTYADWCAPCKKLEKYTFSAPEVQAFLKHFVLVKLDFSQNSEKNRILKKSLRMFGMPTVIFFDSDGKEIKRFFGFVNKRRFLKIVQSLK